MCLCYYDPHVVQYQALLPVASIFYTYAVSGTGQVVVQKISSYIIRIVT